MKRQRENRDSCFLNPFIQFRWSFQWISIFSVLTTCVQRGRLTLRSDWTRQVRLTLLFRGAAFRTRPHSWPRAAFRVCGTKTNKRQSPWETSASLFVLVNIRNFMNSLPAVSFLWGNDLSLNASLKWRLKRMPNDNNPADSERNTCSSWLLSPPLYRGVTWTGRPTSSASWEQRTITLIYQLQASAFLKS